jgi:predicted nucleotidyltransferase
MHRLGETIRKLREDKKLPLRTVAAFLDIDQAILSKIERGQCNANRDNVVKLVEFFKIEENDLLVSWLSDKLVYEVGGEDMALKALRVGEEQLSYRSGNKTAITTTINTIKSVLQNDGRVATAWLLGSMARGEARPDSDVDIMIEFNKSKKYSMFDLLDIAHSIAQKIDRKVDLMQKGQWNDFALKTAAKHLLKIYG